MLNLPPEVQSGLLDRRVVFLRGRLDDMAANDVIGQLVLIARLAEGKSIELYVDSPGGSVGAALTVYDVLRTLESPVSTTCLGVAAGAAVLIVAGGAAGRRFALPHARLHLTEEKHDLQLARPGEIAANAHEIARQRERWRMELVQHCGHSVAQLDRDLTAGRWLSAAEARDYGLVDGIIPGRIS